MIQKNDLFFKSNEVFLSLFTYLVCAFSVAQECNDLVKTGDGTYYDGVDGSASGNCSLPVKSGDVFHAALNTVDYNGSDACGACISVTGPKGSVVVKVVDRCPECKEGDVDMTEEAFSEIADVIDGRVSIQWRFVPCDNLSKDTTVKVNFKEGSSQYWTAIQFRDINHAVAQMEYENGNDNWVKVDRALYNFFIEPMGIASPMRLRITSVLGEQLVLDDIVLNLDQDHDTGKQFSTPQECLRTLSMEEFPKMTEGFYPNPTSGIVYLTKNKEVKWVVRDAYGKIIKKGMSGSIDISASSNGLYFLEIDKSNHHKLLKK